MRLSRERLLLGGRTRIDPAGAAVIGNARRVDVVVDDGRVVSRVDARDVYVVNGTVVVERAVGPVAALITHAEITEPIVDAAVKADVRSPIARVPDVKAVGPA